MSSSRIITLGPNHLPTTTSVPARAFTCGKRTHRGRPLLLWANFSTQKAITARSRSSSFPAQSSRNNSHCTITVTTATCLGHCKPRSHSSQLTVRSRSLRSPDLKKTLKRLRTVTSRSYRLTRCTKEKTKTKKLMDGSTTSIATRLVSCFLPLHSHECSKCRTQLARYLRQWCQKRGQ